MDVLVTALSASGGLILGDSLEIVVERLGAHEGLEGPWWQCPNCKEPASGIGLVPLVCVLQRRRPCPRCQEQRGHPWRPLVLAVVSALVLGAFAVRIGPDIVLSAYCVLGLSLVALSAVDLEHFIIPNRIIYPTLALFVPLLVISSAVDHRWTALAHAAIAGAAGFLFFYVVHWIVPHGMGFGDVRLAGVLGLATGWFGLTHAFIGFLAGFILGAVIGSVVMVVTGGGRKTKIPFGPFLAAGAVVAVVWGNPLVHTFLNRGG
jgi:leader peptidase (prepilin peptidase) / N-methyltransferase